MRARVPGAVPDRDGGGAKTRVAATIPITICFAVASRVAGVLLPSTWSRWVATCRRAVAGKVERCSPAVPSWTASSRRSFHGAERPTDARAE